MNSTLNVRSVVSATMRLLLVGGLAGGTAAARAQTDWDDDYALIASSQDYGVTASDTRGSATSTESRPTMLGMGVSSGTVALVPIGAVWKYLDTGVDQGAGWIAPGSNDSAWLSGLAQFGYGDGDEATTVSFGPDLNSKYITTYFRRTFLVNDANAVSNLNLRLLVDDGAVVYLNGAEVFRANLPAGAVNFYALAISAAENTIHSATLSPDLLINGTNVLAVEVHQNAANSSDLSFDLELLASGAPTAPTITEQPVSQTNITGSTATFSVTASGTPPLAYQWQKDGADLNGQTGASLTLANVQLADGGAYRVIVSNAAGSASSTEATLTVYPSQDGPGSLDLSFVPGINARADVTAVAPQIDGKLLVGGYRLHGESYSLIRLNSDGTKDSSFNVGPAHSVQNSIAAMAIDPSGRILVAAQGWLTNQQGHLRDAILRLNPDGSEDMTFQFYGLSVPGFAGSIDSLVLLSDGKILIGGEFFDGVGGPEGFACLNPDGSLDQTWPLTVRGGNETGVYSLAVQSDGKVLVGGGFEAPQRYLVRLNANGNLDQSVQAEINDQWEMDSLAVLKALALPGGKTLIAGDFASVNGIARQGLARLNADGSLDQSFNPSVRLSDVVIGGHCVLAQPDGKVLVGAAPAGFVRMNTDGSLDTTFYCEAQGVHVAILQTSGKIVIGGVFNSVNGVPCNGLARLNGDGLVAPTITQQPLSQTNIVGSTVTFSVGAAGTPPPSYQWQKNGTHLTGQTSTSLTLANVQLADAGAYRVLVSNSAVTVTSSVALLTVQPMSTSSGSLDLAFDPGIPGFGTIRALAEQPDGKLLVGGNFYRLDQDDHDQYFALARLNPNGSADDTFQVKQVNEGIVVLSLAVQSDGTILTAGYGFPARLNTDGSADTSFEPQVEGLCPAVALQSDSKILIGGNPFLVRFLPDGSRDTNFTATIPKRVEALAVQSDGRIVAGGGGWAARLHPNGEMDATFDPRLSNLPWAYQVNAVICQPDGKTIFGGYFRIAQGVARQHLARFNADGSLDLDFNPVLDSTVWSLALQADGKLLIGGQFTSVGGVARAHIARLNRDGSLDLAFDPGSGIAGGRATEWGDGPCVYGLLVLRNGDVLVGGNFTSFNGVPRPGLARLNGDALAIPIITQQPASRTNTVGSTATFSVGATGTPPLSYQWQRDGFNLNGQTGATLSLANVQLADAGAYRVIVSNGAGSVTSGEATLTVQPSPSGPGSVDPTFANTFDWGNVNDIVLQPDGRILVGGSCSDLLGRARTVVRLLESGGEDTSFEQSPLPGNEGEVNALALQMNGAIVLGGQIASNGQVFAGLVRLTSSGNLDPGFAAPLETYSHINAVAVQPDGRTLAAGVLSLGSRHWFNTVARLMPSGALDTSFDAGAGVSVMDSSAIIKVEPLADGRVLVAGKFTEFSGTPCRGLVRLLADGTIDSSFVPAPQMPGVVYAVAMQPDRRILVAGPPDVLNPSENHFVARLNADGSLDTTFQVIPIPNERIFALAVQANGRILLGGVFTTINGFARRGVARLEANGSLDVSFNPGSGPEGEDELVNILTVQSDGRILVGGSFRSFNGIPCQNLVRLNGDATPPSIVTQPLSQTNYVGRTVAFDVQATGAGPLSYQWLFNGSPIASERDWGVTMLVLTNIQPADAGDYQVIVSNSGGSVTSAVATLTVLPPPIHPGAFDPSFQASLNSEFDSIFAMVKQADGKIIVGGNFYGINGVPRQGIARLNLDGSLDSAFEASLNSGVEALALQVDGKILVGGSFSQVHGVPRQGLARLHADGTLDLSFAASLPAFAWVSAVATQPDGKVLAAVEGMTQDHTLTHLLRFLPDGNVDIAAPVSDASDASIRDIVLQPDGKIVVSGSFQMVNGVPRRSIARLESNGAVDSSFSAGTGIAGIADLVLQPDGRIVVLGGIYQIEQVIWNGVARLMADGIVDTSFAAVVSCCLSAVALQGDGKILVGGGFREFSGVTCNGVARLHSDGSLDTSFITGEGISPIDDSSVLAMVIQDDGSIIIGGTGFVAYDGFPCVGLARLHGGSPAAECRLAAWVCPRTRQPQVVLTGPTGARFLIEATSDLKTWTPLTIVTNAAGTIQVCDPTANASPQRLYRGRLVE